MLSIGSSYFDIYGIFVSLIASVVFFTLWYSKLFFGKTWLKFYERDNIKDHKWVWEAIFMEIFVTLIAVITVSLILEWAMVQNWIDGVQVGLFLGVGLMIPLLSFLFIGYISEKKPFKLFLINGIAIIIDLAIISGVLGYFWSLQN